MTDLDRLKPVWVDEMGWVYLFSEGDLAFLRGLFDRSLLLLLWPLITTHVDTYKLDSLHFQRLKRN